MADLAFPILPASGGWIQGRESTPFSGLSQSDRLAALQQDFRISRSTTGIITDVMVLKTAGGEIPYKLGRVWLLRYVDGFKAWEGWTDASGTYTATGLEIGVDYVAVGIDPTRTHKTTGAGPVTAQ